MPTSRARLTALAGESGFREETLEKVIRLGQLAKDIDRHPFLSEVLVLKGGTALNLAFGSPARLSVDLDFNYIGSPDRARMLEDREATTRHLARLARFLLGRDKAWEVEADRSWFQGKGTEGP